MDRCQVLVVGAGPAGSRLKQQACKAFVPQVFRTWGFGFGVIVLRVPASKHNPGKCKLAKAASCLSFKGGQSRGLRVSGQCRHPGKTQTEAKLHNASKLRSQISLLYELESKYYARSPIDLHIGRHAFHWVEAACMHACMHACMDACMGAWVHGCMDAWMHGCMDGWMDGCERYVYA